MFKELIDLPEELVHYVFKFVDDTTLCRLVGECDQIMRYYNLILSRGYQQHRLKMNMLFDEYKRDITYTIKGDISTYTYNKYLRKLPTVLSIIGCDREVKSENIFYVNYMYLSWKNNYLYINTFKCLDTKHDNDMWFDRSGNMKVRKSLSMIVSTCDAACFDSMAKVNEIIINERTVNKMKNGKIPPYYDDYNKGGVHIPNTIKLPGQIEYFEKQYNVPCDVWKEKMH
jgi:hypothetical protein